MRKNLIGVFCLLPALFLNALALPARPDKANYLNDYAHVMGAEKERARVQSNLQSWNASGKSSLFVVTIEGLSEYQLKDMDSAAQSWFQEWKLGSKDVLLLVSAREHQARAQLGSGWTPAEQTRAERIVEDVVAPLCATGNPSGAVVQGSYALHTLDSTAAVAEKPAPPAPPRARVTRAPSPPPATRGLAYYLSFTAFSWPVTLGLFLLGACVAGVGLASARSGLVALGVLVVFGTAISGLVVTVVKLAFFLALALLAVIIIRMFLGLAFANRGDDCRHHHHCHDRDDDDAGLIGGLLSWFFSKR